VVKVKLSWEASHEGMILLICNGHGTGWFVETMHTKSHVLFDRRGKVLGTFVNLVRAKTQLEKLYLIH